MNSLKDGISIVICTANRVHLLSLCLESITKYDHVGILEVNVIDNLDQIEVKELIKNIANPKIKYYVENKVGLSFARNKGISVSKGSYIYFLDDDCKVLSNTFVNVSKILLDENPSLAGGGWLPFYTEKKPVWLDDNFGKFRLPFSKPTNLNDMFVTGGNFIVKNHVFKSIGYFDTSYGMKREKIGYGEETEFQFRARKNGYKILYIPDIEVLHHVGSHKYILSWHLKSYYEHGIADRFNKMPFISLFREIIKTLFYIVPISIILAFKKFIIDKNFKWQNLIIECLQNFINLIGRIVGRIFY